jgi:hypothetical protein
MDSAITRPIVLTKLRVLKVFLVSLSIDNQNRLPYQAVTERFFNTSLKIKSTDIYSDLKLSSALSMVFRILSLSCEAEIKEASKAEGAR